MKMNESEELAPIVIDLGTARRGECFYKVCLAAQVCQYKSRATSQRLILLRKQSAVKKDI